MTVIDRELYSGLHIWDERNNQELTKMVPSSVELKEESWGTSSYHVNFYLREGYWITWEVSKEIYDSLSETVKSDDNE